MKYRIVALAFLYLLMGCQDLPVIPESHTRTQLELKSQPLPTKVPLFLPSDWGHSKIIWVPISYYSAVKDTSDVMIRLLVPIIWDPNFGMVQATTLNVYNADSFEINGGNLIFYSDSTSSIISYPPEQGQTLSAPYTDSTVVIILYEDSTVNIVPNVRYSTQQLKVPEKPIIGLYFLLTDYYQQ
jgi:hypothetical protein